MSWRVSVLGQGVLFGGIVAFVVGCSPSKGEGAGVARALQPCDPLSPPPTTLESVLAVGQDAAGTYYVADQGPAGGVEGRVFVSDGTTLVRQHVAGAGSSGGPPDADYTFSFEAPFADAAATAALVVQMRGGAITGMALGPGNSRSFFGAAGQTPLTVVDPTLVQSFSIQNLPSVVEYMADIGSGDEVVITAPMDAATSADFRLFYGAPSAMIEYPITAYNLALSGFGDIAFSVGTATFTLHLTITAGVDASPLGMLGPGSLDTDRGTFPATFRVPTPTTLPGFSFTCSTAASDAEAPATGRASGH
jgi:hypothetical protein